MKKPNTPIEETPESGNNVDLHLIIQECVADTIAQIKEKLGIQPLAGSPS